MRKLVIVAVTLSVLGLPFTLAVPSHATYQLNSLQVAGDDGPHGG